MLRKRRAALPVPGMVRVSSLGRRSRRAREHRSRIALMNYGLHPRLSSQGIAKAINRSGSRFRPSSASAAPTAGAPPRLPPRRACAGECAAVTKAGKTNPWAIGAKSGPTGGSHGIENLHQVRAGDCKRAVIDSILSPPRLDQPSEGPADAFGSSSTSTCRLHAHAIPLGPLKNGLSRLDPQGEWIS